jgi:hypothetical protein
MASPPPGCVITVPLHVRAAGSAQWVQSETRRGRRRREVRRRESQSGPVKGGAWGPPICALWKSIGATPTAVRESDSRPPQRMSVVQRSTAWGGWSLLCGCVSPSLVHAGLQTGRRHRWHACTAPDQGAHGRQWHARQAGRRWTGGLDRHTRRSRLSRQAGQASFIRPTTVDETHHRDARQAADDSGGRLRRGRQIVRYVSTTAEITQPIPPPFAPVTGEGRRRRYTHARPD